MNVNQLVLIIGLWLALWPAAPTRAEGDPLTLDDIFELETVSDPQISPDGTQVVYVRHFSEVMTDRRYTNLWIVNVDGSGHRPLTTGRRNDASPRWSPSGDRLAYVTVSDGEAQIRVRWMDTGTTHDVTHVRKTPYGLAWSPDGRQISFAALVPSGPVSIGKSATRPGGAQWAPPAQVIDQPVYRFDQQGYLETGHYQVFVVPADGGTARQLTSGGFNPSSTIRRGSGVWTPDGRYLIVPGHEGDDAWRDPRNSELYEVSVDTGERRALTDREGPDLSPAVSPDGSRIAYIGFDDRFQGYQLSRLYVMDRDGANRRVVGADLDRSVGNPRWTGDGRAIIATYVDEGVTRLARFDLDGGMTPITSGLSLGGASTAYAGGDFTLSSNGAFAFAFADETVPSDVAVGRLDGPDVRRITEVNEDLVSQRAVGEIQELRYKSSLDGRMIEGWIITPPDFDPAKKYPLVLEIHGGPFAAYGPDFDIEKQLMAASGYVVFYANPRGSTSYGEEFGNLIHHAYPGDDFHDLNSGLDAVIAKGFVDPEQLFVTGGSGGGVLTAWMIGHTDRFRAAVAAYPVINWTSWVLTSDITELGIRYWFPGPPWEDAENYEQRSLLSVVGKVTTPTMVMTGEEDYRTPISESEQYYKALKVVGVESVLVRVPGEPHGIRRRPSHHAQKVGLILGWFDRHRGDDKGN